MILDSLTTAEIKAIVVLTDDKDFQVYKNMMERQLESIAVKSTKKKDDTECRWFQGSAQTFGELIRFIDGAKKYLNLINEQENRIRR